MSATCLGIVLQDAIRYVHADGKVCITAGPDDLTPGSLVMSTFQRLANGDCEHTLETEPEPIPFVTPEDRDELQRAMAANRNESVEHSDERPTNPFAEGFDHHPDKQETPRPSGKPVSPFDW